MGGGGKEGRKGGKKGKEGGREKKGGREGGRDRKFFSVVPLTPFSP